MEHKQIKKTSFQHQFDNTRVTHEFEEVVRV